MNMHVVGAGISGGGAAPCTEVRRSFRCGRPGRLPRLVGPGARRRRCAGRTSVLIHPSAREGASSIVGEATAAGLPVVCFAGTGAASVLDTAGTSEMWCTSWLVLLSAIPAGPSARYRAVHFFAVRGLTMNIWPPPQRSIRTRPGAPAEDG